MEEEQYVNKGSIPMEMIRWWESKRLIYNAVILLMTIVTLIFLWEDLGISIKAPELLFNAFWIIIWANVLYTSGWAGGVLRQYYFGSYPFSSTGRWLLFILGTIFSVLVMETRLATLVNPMFAG